MKCATRILTVLFCPRCLSQTLQLGFLFSLDGFPGLAPMVMISCLDTPAAWTSSTGASPGPNAAPLLGLTFSSAARPQPLILGQAEMKIKDYIYASLKKLLMWVTWHESPAKCVTLQVHVTWFLPVYPAHNLRTHFNQVNSCSTFNWNSQLICFYYFIYYSLFLQCWRLNLGSMHAS